MKRTALGIIGFGRFGKVIHRLFADGFDILVSSSSYQLGDVPGVTFASLDETVSGSAALFLAVPINRTESIARKIKPFLTPGQVVVDVCSVKEYPYGVLKNVLAGTGAAIWPTHPMFGPDSSQNGFKGLNWVSCEEDIDPSLIAPYLEYLERKGLIIVKTTCEAHDRMAAGTQGFTHLIGRFLDELRLQSTQIDTLGYQRLLAVREQTCHDSWELFCDLQHYNRFSTKVQSRLSDAIFKVTAKLRAAAPGRVTPIVGVVEGVPPHEEALRRLLASAGGKGARLREGEGMEIKRVASPSALLFDLTRGEVDFGLLPLWDDVGGFAAASVEAMGQHQFTLVDLLEYRPNGAEAATGFGEMHFALVSWRRWESDAMRDTL